MVLFIALLFLVIVIIAIFVDVPNYGLGIKILGALCAFLLFLAVLGVLHL